MIKKLSQRTTSNKSASEATNLEALNEEIEALEFTLAPHEYKRLESQGDVVKIELTILPSFLEEKPIFAILNGRDKYEM